MKESQPERRMVDNRLKKFIIETRLLYALLIVMGAVLGSLYDDVKDINRNRAIDNATTIKTICERQEFVLEKVVDTKKRIGNSNINISRNAKTLRSLFKSVMPIATEKAKKPLNDALDRIESTLDNLRENNDTLRTGRAALELELARVNCAKLPAVDPFGGETATQGEATTKEKEK